LSRRRERAHARGRTVGSTAARQREGRSTHSASWMRIDEAARILAVRVVTLRRAIDRNARRDSTGCIDAAFDGVRARKLGRHWRVLLDPCWAPSPPPPY
jgi:hypothetical protein